jgi:hypothetical protein
MRVADALLGKEAKTIASAAISQNVALRFSHQNLIDIITTTPKTNIGG